MPTTIKEILEKVLDKRNSDQKYKITVYYNIFKSLQGGNTKVPEEKNESSSNIKWNKNGVEGSFQIDNRSSIINVVSILIMLQNKLMINEENNRKIIEKNLLRLTEQGEEEPENNQNPTKQELPPSQDNQEVPKDQQQEIQNNQPKQQDFKDMKLSSLTFALKKIGTIPTLSEADTLILTISKKNIQKKDLEDEDIKGDIGIWITSAQDKIYYYPIINGIRSDLNEQELTGDALSKIDSEMQNYITST
jgi:hypothetical protein